MGFVNSILLLVNPWLSAVPPSPPRTRRNKKSNAMCAILFFAFSQVGGFSSRELIRLLRSMKGLNIISGDVVEVAPAYDHAGKEGEGAHGF